MTGVDAVPAGFASRKRGSRAATGLHSQALGPAARSWLTGVAGPRSRKRGPYAVLTPLWRAERRPCSSREEHGLRKECRASSARHALGIRVGGRTLPAPLSEGRRGRGRTRRRQNNTGGGALAVRLFCLSRHPEEAAKRPSKGLGVRGPSRRACGARLRTTGRVTLSRPSS